MAKSPAIESYRKMEEEEKVQIQVWSGEKYASSNQTKHIWKANEVLQATDEENKACGEA